MHSHAEIGSEVAGYRVEELLGRGGMGVVYLAEDSRLKRKVALKILSPELAADEVFRRRFIHETELAASVDHPNVVPVYEAGEWQDILYMAMRYVLGTDLKSLLRRDGALDPTRAVWIASQAAGALDAAHARGLVHRDVKPGNILLAEGEGPGGLDHVYLADFGLTKLTESPSTLTGAGRLVGTISYIAPEQIAGEVVDGRTDQYALGCVLFECLADRAPFVGEHEAEVLFAHVREPVPHVSNLRADVEPAIDVVIARAMAKSRDERYPDCATFARAAQAALGAGPVVTLPASHTVSVTAARKPGRARKVGTLLLAAGVVAIGALVGFLSLGGPETGPDRLSVSGAVFVDDFEDPGSGWDQVTTDGFAIQYQEGSYRVTLTGAPFATSFSTNIPSLRSLMDVRIEVDVTKVVGRGSDGFGVACRVSPSLEAYYLLLSSDGSYAIQKSGGGTTKTLTEGFSAAIRRGLTTNYIRAECLGGRGGEPVTLRLVANGQDVVSIKDKRGGLPSGAIGMAVTGQEGLDVRFDNFVAREA